MGRIGGKAILYFEIVTTIALFVGLGAVNLVQPGVGVQLHKGAAPGVAQTSASVGADLWSTRSRPASSIRWRAAKCCRSWCSPSSSGPPAPPSARRPARWWSFANRFREVMFQYTNYVMLFAPFGVFGAMAATVGDKGIGVSGEPRQAGGDAVRRGGVLRGGGVRAR